jgi:hypothetical protein
MTHRKVDPPPGRDGTQFVGCAKAGLEAAGRRHTSLCSAKNGGPAPASRAWLTLRGTGVSRVALTRPNSVWRAHESSSRTNGPGESEKGGH